MNMKPELEPTLAPAAPTDDMNASTSGSWRTISTSFIWFAFISSKDTPWAPSVKAKMAPMSSDGRSPIGIFANITTVTMVMSRVTTMVVRRYLRVFFRVRS